MTWYLITAVVALHIAPIYPAIRKLVVIEAAGQLSNKRTLEHLLNLIFIPFFGLYILIFKRWPKN